MTAPQPKGLRRMRWHGPPEPLTDAPLRTIDGSKRAPESPTTPRSIADLASIMREFWRQRST
jgi:hypothetical protein